MKKILIIGSGPAGLSAAYILNKNKKKLTLIEKGKTIGGLSRTITKEDFKFDLGGHRFFTKNKEVNEFVKDLLKDELIDVPRKSRIYLNNKFFDYPLKPSNALFSMGIFKTFEIISDYGYMKLKNLIKLQKDVSFEDWVVNRFGRTMFNLYFKPYTEKVWGIPCSQLSADWAVQRIKGMSLRSAIKNAFYKSKEIPKSLITEFKFPKYGIGVICNKLVENIPNSSLILNSEVTKINHKNKKIVSIEINNKEILKADNFISTMPISELIKILIPKPQKDILKSANLLTYRDELFVFLRINKPQITKDSWIYFPDDNISFMRLHEPKNWSKWMAPKSKSSLVMEFACNIGDSIWNAKDEKLIEITINDLTKKLKFIKKEDIIDGMVIRERRAYPIYKIGYKEHISKLKNYLKNFANLQIIGRYGTFQYNNIDHSIECGIKAAKNLLGEKHNLELVGSEKQYLEIEST